ncbi:hypothetical protein ACJX0J_037872, partial [Zea mays]
TLMGVSTPKWKWRDVSVTVANLFKSPRAVKIILEKNNLEFRIKRVHTHFYEHIYSKVSLSVLTPLKISASNQLGVSYHHRWTTCQYSCTTPC